MNPKTKRQLERILTFAKRVRQRTKSVSIETFLNDDFLQDAVVYCLGQMGEIACKIPEEEQEKYPDLFWNQMTGLRHRLFHDYEAIDFSMIYHVTQEPISQMVLKLESILSREA